MSEETNAVVYNLNSSDIFGSYVGESERRMRDLFDKAQADAVSGEIVVVFMDEVTALYSRWVRVGTKSMDPNLSGNSSLADV